MKSTVALALLAALTAFFVGNLGPGVLQNDRAVAQDSKPAKETGLKTVGDTKKTENSGLTLQAAVKREPLRLEHNLAVDPDALNEATQCEFVGTPLEDVVAFLSELHEIPIMIDRTSLSEFGVAIDQPISISVVSRQDKNEADDVPLRQLLDWICRDFELSWSVSDGIIHMTSKDADFAKSQTNSYNVLPLLTKGFLREELVDVILEATAGPWEDIDGEGGSLSLVGDVLTIRHAHHVQHECLALLEALLNPAPQSYVLYPNIHPRVLKKLDAVIDQVDFVANPLGDVIAFLSDAVSSRIDIDSNALDDAGIAIDEPINLHLKKQPLRVVFDLLVKDLELKLIVVDGQLTVTTRDGMQESLYALVYDVSDITETERTEFVDAIQNTTAGLWQENDGSGGIAQLPDKQLVVQTQEVHQEIWNLLRFHRHAKSKNAKAQAAANVNRDPNEQVKRFYRLPEAAVDDLIGVLPDSVASESWSSLANPTGTGKIWKVTVGSDVSDAKFGTKSVLIILQTEKVHGEIQQFLKTLGLPAKGLTKDEIPQHRRNMEGGGFGPRTGGFGGGGHF